MVAAVLLVAGPACETGGEPRILTLSGTVRDYFSGTALPNVTLTWDTPAKMVTSNGTGGYLINNLEATEILFLSATLANYRPTRNEPAILGTSNLTADQAVVGVADATRQYTSVGQSTVNNTSVVFVNLINAAGQPHEGIPLADIEIVDTLDQALGLGPYVFGSGGDIVSQATLSVTTAFGGRSRVGFLNVPAGTYQLRVAYDDAGTPRTKTAQVVAVANGATLIRR